MPPLAGEEPAAQRAAFVIGEEEEEEEEALSATPRVDEPEVIRLEWTESSVECFLGHSHSAISMRPVCPIVVGFVSAPMARETEVPGALSVSGSSASS